MAADPVDAYHDLLAADPALAAESQAALDRGQDARGLAYGDRPVCTVLRPRFLTARQYRFLHDRVNVLLPALRAAHDTLAEILASGQQRNRLPSMLTRAELYELLDYHGYEARDKSYFGLTKEQS